MYEDRESLQTILVVDDLEDSRVMLRRLLEAGNYRVVEAADGKQAVEVALSVRPDLILLDLNLPVMDGLEMTKLIRKHYELRRVPIIAFTAYDVYGIREAALEAGCNEYLAKPLDIDRLEKTIRRLLQIQ